MRKYVLLEKALGQTPLEAILEWKAAHPRYRDVPASYAGRLDPMATGKLLVLLGDECKRQERYTGLDKTYDVEVLLDIGSDTGDVLGIVEPSGARSSPSRTEVGAALAAQRGTHVRPYPAFSSKPVSGKPLFLHALEGTLDSIEIPTHEESIYHVRYRGSYTLSTTELKERVASLLALAPKSEESSKRLGADFRIATVRESWETVWRNDRDYHVLRFTISCGSGTYMRSLAARLGATLGTNALALAIHRTRIAIPFRYRPF